MTPSRLLLAASLCCLLVLADAAPAPAAHHRRWGHRRNAVADASRERRAPRQRSRDESVKAAENLTLCPHEVQVDLNKLRIPQRIEHVVCRETNCKCTQVGDYRCTQLYSEMEVAHLSEETGEVIARDKMQVKYGCFCATRSGYHIKPGEKPRLVK